MLKRIINNIVNKRLLIYLLLIQNFGIVFSQQTPRGLLKESEIPLSSIYSNKWAFIIGINEYTEYNDLQYAVRDAESIKAILQEQFNFPEENIIIKVNENATKNEITEGFYSLAEKTDPNDAVVIFFAGHGETRTIGVENKNLGYLIPSDSKVGEKHLTRTAISMENLHTWSNEIQAKHMLFLIDACYGGLAMNVHRANKKIDYVKSITNDPSRLIITAGRKDEKVVEGPQWEHSAFTAALIDGLLDMKADIEPDGIILIPELFAFVKTRVIKDTNGKQNPQFSSFIDNSGEFAFIDEDLIAGGMDIDLSGYGYLTIPKDLFDGIIRIDDKPLNINTPLIDYVLESGYHLISIVKKGYKQYNKKVLIKTDETYILNPSLDMISGIMSFVNLPQSSQISIDGNFIGKLPINNQPLKKGTHEIFVSIPGYESIEPIKYTIDTSIVYYLQIPSLIPKTKLKALIRSVILPGWGQLYYERPIRGYGFIGLNILMGGYLLSNEIKYYDQFTKYESAINEYKSAIDNVDEKWLIIEKEKEILDKNIENARMGMYVIAGVYTYNFIDIIFSKGDFTHESNYGLKIPIETKFGFSKGEIKLINTIYLK